MRRGGSPERGSTRSRAVEPKRFTHKAVPCICPVVSACRSPASPSAPPRCSSAPAAAAPIPTATRSCRPTAVAVVGTETVSKAKLDDLLAQVCVQYKAAKKACPKPGTAARKQLQQSFVAQLVQQAEFDVAGKQLKVDRQAEGHRLEPAEARAAVRQGRQWQGRRREVEEGPHGQPHERGQRLDNIKDGLLRQAIYAKLTKNITVTDAAIAAYYTKNKANYATPASRADPPHPGQGQGARRQDLLGALQQRRAVRCARGEVHDRPGLEEDRRQAGHHPEGPDRPDLRQGGVQHPDRQGRAARQEQLRLARDRGHGRHRPGIAAAARRDAEGDDPHPAAQHQEADLANKWFTTFQKKLEKNVRYAAGMRSRQDDEHRGDDCARPRPRPADAALGCRSCSERRLARRRAAGRLRRQQRLGQRRAQRAQWQSSTARTSRSPQLETTMNIARLSLKTSYPEPGTENWVSLRSRALESLAHDAELRAWAKNLGVTVKPSAVDAAVKASLSNAFPGKTAGTIDQAKVDAEFKSTGMTRELFRSRTETKLLAQAAANKVARSPERHGRAGQGSLREGEVDHVRAAGAPQAAPHPRQGQGARRPAVYATRVLGCEVRRAREAVLDRHSQQDERRRARGGQQDQSRQAVRRRRLHDPPGRRLSTGEVAVRLAPDRGRGPDPARGRASARRDTAAADPHPARAGGAAEEHREAVQHCRDRAEQGYPVRSGVRPAHRVHAVTDGAELAPRALIVALGPGEPELVPARALAALHEAGSVAPHGLPAVLRASLEGQGVRFDEDAATVCAPDVAAHRARAQPAGGADAARAAAARPPGGAVRRGCAAGADGAAAP